MKLIILSKMDVLNYLQKMDLPFLKEEIYRSVSGKGGNCLHYALAL